MFKWTIKAKLFVMGAVAAVVLTVMMGMSWMTETEVSAANDKVKDELQQLEQLSELRQASTEIVLAVMDSIVDMHEGVVLKERQDTIDAGFTLYAEQMSGIEHSAMEAEERGKIKDGRALIREMKDALAKLDRVANVDLKEGVRAQSNSLLAEVDDSADALGEVLAEAIDSLYEASRSELNDAVEAADGAVATSAKISLVTYVLGIGGLLGLLLAIGLSITRPIARLTGVMGLLAGGRLDVAIADLGRNDEVGEMAGAVQVFKDNAIEKVRLEKDQEAAKLRAEEEKRQQMLELAGRFERSVKEVVDGVSSAATEMQATAQQMSATAEETSRQAGNVATASDQATTNVQTVAATAEELAASVAEIGRQVGQSAKIAGNAVREAEATNETVQGLAEAAQKIGDVVALINNIAGQTNLLALNATIEAARAGEAGKGFAVVAQEVKNLANQTAKATEEISAQILAVQEETNGAVGAIEKIRAVIGEISDISTTIASAVEEQGLSTQEIARNVQQAAQGTQMVNQNIESVSQAAGQTGAAATQVLSASEEMARQAEGLRGEVDRFLREIRAG